MLDRPRIVTLTGGLMESSPPLDVLRPLADIVVADSPEALARLLPSADILFIWDYRFAQLDSLLPQAPRLRWIQSASVGVEPVISPGLRSSDIVLTNAREVHGPVVAEHVIALIFALAKKIPDAVRLQQKHEWGQQRMWDELPRVREIAGATLGLIGLGSIGSAVAKSAKGLGMRVIAVREHPQKGSAGADAVFGPAQIDDLFRESDYVVLAAPVTSQTNAIANANRLALMKPDACLVNVARGQLVDEVALASVLRAKKIGGAALDVFPKEPLAAESPLWDVPGLLVTPHTAALTEKLWERHYALFSENLRRYLSGAELLGIVDKRKGY